MEERIALAACIVVGSMLIGKSLAGSARRRAGALKKLEEGCKVLRVHITNMLEPVRSALSRSECPLLARVGEGMAEGVSADAAWQSIRPQARRRGGFADAMTEKDVHLLDRLFAQLGQSGREAQDIHLNDIIAELELAYGAARDRAVEADRLYGTLGLLIGLMLALIVI